MDLFYFKMMAIQICILFVSFRVIVCFDLQDCDVAVSHEASHILVERKNNNITMFLDQRSTAMTPLYRDGKRAQPTSYQDIVSCRTSVLCVGAALF